MEVKATRHFLLLKHGAGVEDPVLRELSESFADHLDNTLHGLREELSRVARDPAYTSIGVQRERATRVQRAATALQQEADERIGQMRKAIEHYEGRFWTAAQSRLQVPKGMDPDDARAMEREARELIREMDPIEREALYRKAVREGDTSTLRAFELAPPAFPLVTEEQKQAAITTFVEQADPALVKTLEEQRRTLDILDHHMQTAGRHLTQIAGVHVGPDPVVAVVVGEANN